MLAGGMPRLRACCVQDALPLVVCQFGAMQKHGHVHAYACEGIWTLKMGNGERKSQPGHWIPSHSLTHPAGGAPPPASAQ